MHWAVGTGLGAVPRIGLDAHSVLRNATEGVPYSGIAVAALPVPRKSESGDESPHSKDKAVCA